DAAPARELLVGRPAEDDLHRLPAAATSARAATRERDDPHLRDLGPAAIELLKQLVGRDRALVPRPERHVHDAGRASPARDRDDAALDQTVLEVRRHIGLGLEARLDHLLEASALGRLELRVELPLI